MKILIIPNNLINPICDQIQVMVGLSSGEEEIDLSILMLQDDLCSIFIGEDSENGVIWFVLHDHVFIFNVIVFQS